VDDELLTPEEAAAYLRKSEQTLANWRSRGKGPTYIKVEGGVRYRDSDLKRYLEQNTVTS